MKLTIYLSLILLIFSPLLYGKEGSNPFYEVKLGDDFPESIPTFGYKTSQLGDSFLTRAQIFENDKLPAWVRAEGSTASITREYSQVGSRSLNWNVKPGAKLIFTFPKGLAIGPYANQYSGPYANRFLVGFSMHYRFSEINTDKKAALKVRFMVDSICVSEYKVPAVATGWRYTKMCYFDIEKIGQVKGFLDKGNREQSRSLMKKINRVEIVASEDIISAPIFFDYLVFRHTLSFKSGKKGKVLSHIPDEIRLLDPVNDPENPALEKIPFDRALLAEPTSDELAFVSKRQADLEAHAEFVLEEKHIDHIVARLKKDRVLGWGPKGIRDCRPEKVYYATHSIRDATRLYKKSKSSQKKERLKLIILKAFSDLMDLGFNQQAKEMGTISLFKKGAWGYEEAISNAIRSGAFTNPPPEYKNLVSDLFNRYMDGKVDQMLRVDHPFSSRPEGLLFVVPLWQNVVESFPTARERAIYWRFYSQRLSNMITLQTSQSMGWKDDGSMMDHGMQYPGYCIQGLTMVAQRINELKDTPYALSSDCVQKVRHILMTTRWYSNLKSTGKGHRGRRGAGPGGVSLSKAYKSYFLSSRKYNNGEYDMEFGGALARLYPEQVQSIKEETGIQLIPELSPQGNYTMPFAGTNSQRRKDWLVIVRGSGAFLRPFESMGHVFREGRFLGNGTLDIIGGRTAPGERITDKGSGAYGQVWDWRMIDGATTLLMPYTEFSTHLGTGGKGGGTHTNVGGISMQGQNGAFLLPLDKKCHFVDAVKSYFFFDDRIVCLGSGISASKDHPVITTLFQKNRSFGTGKSVIDGQTIDAVDKKVVGTGKSHWLLDPQNNGYFIPGDQELTLQHRIQTEKPPWPRDHSARISKGDVSEPYALAWLNHGIKPEDASYRYFIQVETTPETIENFAAKMQTAHPPIQILQQDANAHVVYDRATGIHAGLFTKDQKVNLVGYAIISVDRSCLIMSKQNDQRIELTLADPKFKENTELHVRLKGLWRLERNMPRVKLKNEKGDTLIYLRPEWGCSYDLSLIP